MKTRMLLLILILAAALSCKKDEPAPISQPVPEPIRCVQCQVQTDGRWLDKFCGKKSDVDIYRKGMEAQMYHVPGDDTPRHLYKCKDVMP